MRVGDAFYTFEEAILRDSYRLQKRWVTEVRGSSYRHAGGAVESPHAGPSLPWCSAYTAKEAFRVGKRDRIEAIRRAEAAVRERYLREMERLRKEKAKLRALKLEDVRVDGDNETYGQFKDNWNCDY